jgi:hypothetical protein
VGWTERWPNVLFDNRRTLVIRLRRGLIRNVLITPPYPFEFKATLEQARDAALRTDTKNTKSAPIETPSGKASLNPRPKEKEKGKAKDAA